ncbi:had superfamily phosphatase [Pyrenophora seminiperda CCB06]|uniref:Had superfamily phosphatase n=1 Tax=Pyrenophora seminiperda CCB06 TaxID=1302712 RepID=A0A3M7M9L5_9PLEO|nr:had superfamily phosphatase [Pyrenophora seminiperda CCB06]
MRYTSHMRTTSSASDAHILARSCLLFPTQPNHAEAAILEANTGVKVLRHSTKKPGCKEEVMAYFKAHPESGVTKPDQIAVVGDRLSTDVMMANLMGSYGVWVRDGVQGRGFFARVEDRLQGFLVRRGYSAPDPSDNQFQ